jgi:hypothetical protein
MASSKARCPWVRGGLACSQRTSSRPIGSPTIDPATLFPPTASIRAGRQWRRVSSTASALALPMPTAFPNSSTPTSLVRQRPVTGTPAAGCPRWLTLILHIRPLAVLCDQDVTSLDLAWLPCECIPVGSGQIHRIARPRERAPAISEKALGADHPHVAIGFGKLAGSVRVLGSARGGGAVRAACPGHQRKSLGSDHPATKAIRSQLGRFRFPAISRRWTFGRSCLRQMGGSQCSPLFVFTGHRTADSDLENRRHFSRRLLSPLINGELTWREPSSRDALDVGHVQPWTWLPASAVKPALAVHSAPRFPQPTVRATRTAARGA